MKMKMIIKSLPTKQTGKIRHCFNSRFFSVNSVAKALV
jgi:hypothetical protein